MEFWNISDIKKEVVAPTERIKHSEQRALERSIKEGTAGSISNLGDTFITPFALLLKASPFQIGMLSSLSSLIAPITQLGGAKLMERHPRKKIVLFFVLAQALTWIPIAILSLLAWKDIIPLALPYLAILIYTLVVALGGFAHPSWFSWMGDLVPPNKRGKYFTIRNKVTGAVGLGAVLIGAFILDYFKTHGLVLLGFSIIFVLSFIFRMISFSYFRKQFAPKFKLQKGYYFSFWQFLKRFDNYGKYSVYKLFFYLALMTASPFFTVYMLQELKFSYVTFIIVSISASVFYLILAPLAGKFSDKFGNMKLMYLGGFAISVYPLCWIFIKSPIWLILIPQLISGIANAALTIAFTNFTYDSVSPQKRGICVAYESLLIGIGSFIGSLIGGYIISSLHPSSMNPFIFVFIISAAARFLASFIFLPHLEEERKVERLPPMHVQLTHPFKTLHSEIGWFKSIFIVG